MYLHLGQDTVVRLRDIIGIFDLENASTARSTRRYLMAATKRGKVVNVTGELPKSFIVCRDEGGESVYISQISSSTLKKRCRFVEGINIENTYGG